MTAVSIHLAVEPGQIAPHVLMPGDQYGVRTIVRVGLVFSSDSFYRPVSDHVVAGEQTSAAEREHTFGHMVEVALEAMLTPPVG